MTIYDALPVLVCPDCKQPLTVESPSLLLCSANAARYAVTDGIPNFTERVDGTQATTGKLEMFETLYTSQSEPWSYSGRAAEVMRHEFVTTIASRLAPTAERVLDLGCSNGQLSKRLGEVFPCVFSLDISPTAVHTAHRAVQPSKADYFFLAASSTELPFAHAVFDLIVVSDGLHGWELPRPLQEAVVAECSRALKPNGYAVFTDYLHPRKHHALIDLVDASSLQRVEVNYLHDRLWYQTESWFHLVQGSALAKFLLRNISLAQVLKRLSALRGANGSKHICVVARK
jgi:SAM-dependent methyltransferase